MKEHPTYTRFANNLKIMRKHLGLRQRHIADDLGCRLGTYASWEEGRGVPNLTFLTGLSMEYGVTIDELVKEDLSKKFGDLQPK